MNRTIIAILMFTGTINSYADNNDVLKDQEERIKKLENQIENLHYNYMMLYREKENTVRMYKYQIEDTQSRTNSMIEKIKRLEQSYKNRDHYLNRDVFMKIKDNTSNVMLIVDDIAKQQNLDKAYQLQLNSVFDNIKRARETEFCHNTGISGQDHLYKFGYTSKILSPPLPEKITVKWDDISINVIMGDDIPPYQTKTVFYTPDGFLESFIYNNYRYYGEDYDKNDLRFKRICRIKI